MYSVFEYLKNSADTGWSDADAVIAATLVGVFALTLMASFVDAFLGYRGSRRRVPFSVLVGAAGGGLIRGILWHWAWWIHRWAEASLFGDLVFGTLIFCVEGAVVGASIGFFLRLILAWPQWLLIRALDRRAGAL